MPRLVEATPKYRLHKASGQAIVSIQGHDFYLGPWNTKGSKVEYDRIICEWLAAGRQLPAANGEASDLTIVEVLARYKKFAVQHYQKDGVPTGEWDNIQYAIEPLMRLYSRTLVRDFGPLALKSLQAQMITTGLSRSVINSRIGKIKRIFRWAVSEQLALPSLLVGLQAVMGLQRGRTAAREPKPIMPVSDEVVDQTLPCLPELVADMVRFQRLTGCRPGEVCSLRPRDIDRSGEIWRYVPSSHKMEHRDRRRVIFIGPKAMEVLTPYLLRAAEAYCFSPEETDRRRKIKLRAKRKSPVQPSQVDRSKQNPKRKPGLRYNKKSYCGAIHRACEKAGVECWSPNRLRHTSATEIRSRYGLEAAQAVLGHARADVTQVYAERDQALAAEIMRKIG